MFDCRKIAKIVLIHKNIRSHISACDILQWCNLTQINRSKTHYPMASHNSLKKQYLQLFIKCQYVFTVTILLVLQTNGEIAWVIAAWDSLGTSHNLPRIFFCFLWNKNPTSWWNSYTYDGYTYIIITTETILTKDLSTSKTTKDMYIYRWM